MTNTKSSTHTWLVTVRGPGYVFVPPTRTVACAQTVQQRGKVVRRVCVRPRRSWRLPTLLPLRLLVTCTADRRGYGRWPSSFLPFLPFFLYLLLHLLLPQQQQQQQRLHPLRLRSALSAESPIISTARRAHGGGHAIHMRAPVAWHTHTHAACCCSSGRYTAAPTRCCVSVMLNNQLSADAKRNPAHSPRPTTGVHVVQRYSCKG